MATDLKDHPAGHDDPETTSGIPVRASYGPEGVSGVPYPKIGRPGEYPYTRGLYPDMYRKRRWTMRQYAGYADAAESNRRYRYLLEQGTTGLSVAFDLPTQIGYDSDHAMARGEVGRVGVAIDSLDDMRRLFDRIPLDRVTTSMTINSTAAILLSLYLAVAEEQGVAWEKVGGTLQNDILKEYAARGTYIYPPGPSMRLVTDVIEFCAERVPRFNPISISGYHMREAGSTAAQEIAFTIADGIAYVEAAVAEANLSIIDEATEVVRRVEQSGGVRFAEGDISRFDRSRLQVDRHAVLVGEQVAVVPNHACPVIDLYDSFVATRSGEIVGRWPVDARGRSG